MTLYHRFRHHNPGNEDPGHNMENSARARQLPILGPRHWYFGPRRNRAKDSCLALDGNLRPWKTPGPPNSWEPHTPSTTTQRLVLPSFPLFGGEWGFTLASLHTFCLYPLAFASVSCRFKALFTTQHRHRPVVYPATHHSTFYASYRSLRYACGYTSRWGPEMAYQHSIREVPSSGCLKNPTRCECWDTRSVQALRTDNNGQDPLLGHHQNELQEWPYDNITLLPPYSCQARRWSARPVWPREYAFLDLRKRSACKSGWGIPLR